MTPTPKQIRLLTGMFNRPVIAPWSCSDLVKLERAGLVSGKIASHANGTVHSSKVWMLTDSGHLFLRGNKA